MEDVLKYKRIKKLEMMHDDYITRAEDLYLDNKITESVNLFKNNKRLNY